MIKISGLVLTVLLMCTGVNATNIKASAFGWNDIDATMAFQNAVKSNYDTIIVDLQNSNWIVGPCKFSDLKNKTIIFENEVVLKAKAGAYSKYASMLEFVRGVNITIIGYGATLKMNKAEYAAMAERSEFRHCILLSNCNNIKVYGLKLMESGGDGILIYGSTDYGPDNYSEYITLKDLWSDNNYRQGISVVSAQHVYVSNCWFTNTKGTAPMAGVDIEPDNSQQRMIDVVFEKCRFTGNYGNGISVTFYYQDNTALPVDVTFKDCYSSDNYDASNTGYAATEILLFSKANNAVTGTVKFERCLVENSKWKAVDIRKTSNSFFVTFNDCVFKDVSKNTAINYNNPIFIQVTDYTNPVPRFGAVAFNNCLIAYNTNFPFLGSYGEINTSAGMGNVQFNNVTVFHPNSNISYDVTSGGGSPSADCIFNFQKFTVAPATTVSYAADTVLRECPLTNSLLKISRATGSNNTYPLAVPYAASGSAVQGFDFSRMNGFTILPTGSNNAADTFFSIRNKIAEVQKESIVTVNTSSHYSTASASQKIIIYDCILDTVTENNNGAAGLIKIFPNPVKAGLLNISTKGIAGKKNIVIADMMGRLIFTQQLKELEIQTITLNKAMHKGLYVVKIFTTEKNYSQLLLVN